MINAAPKEVNKTICDRKISPYNEWRRYVRKEDQVRRKFCPLEDEFKKWIYEKITGWVTMKYSRRTELINTRINLRNTCFFFISKCLPLGQARVCLRFQRTQAQNMLIICLKMVIFLHRSWWTKSLPSIFFHEKSKTRYKQCLSSVICKHSIRKKSVSSRMSSFSGYDIPLFRNIAAYSFSAKNRSLKKYIFRLTHMLMLCLENLQNRACICL